MIGAKWVLIIWFGWLIVSASITTNCNPRANSKILSTSFCTSTKNTVKWGQIKWSASFWWSSSLCYPMRKSDEATIGITHPTLYSNLQRFFFKPSFCSFSALSACFASERSAGIRVILTLPSKWRRMKSKTAFCIISVTETIIKIQTRNDCYIDDVTSFFIFHVNPRNFHIFGRNFFSALSRAHKFGIKMLQIQKKIIVQ